MRRLAVLLALPILSNAVYVAAQQGARPGETAEVPLGTEPLAVDPPAEPTARDIRELIDSLAERDGAERYAGAPLDHARLALERAEEFERRGERAAATRARQIAWAATSLAAKRIALAQERQALRAAARRLARAERRAEQARRALAHAIEQRDRLRAPASEEEVAPVTEPTEEETE